MKTLTYLSFVFVLSINAEFLNAQIIINQNDMINVGESLTRSTDSLAIGANLGSAGANQSWDFSNAVAHTTTTTNAVLPPNQATFPNANMALTTDNTNYIYVNKQPGFFDIVGLTLDIGTAVNAPLNPPYTQYQFPTEYGNIYSDNYLADVEFSGAAFGVHRIRYKTVGTVNDTIDAYGMVTTPIGTYETLRKKQVVNAIDSIWIKLTIISPWTLQDASNNTTVTYYWIAENMKLPIVEIVVNNAGVPTNLIYTLQLPPVDADFEFTVECPGSATQFTDLSTGQPVAWNWDFGDGAGTSTAQNPQYFYSTSGFYDVTLSASRDGDTSSVTFQVEVPALPVANAGSDAFICLGSSTSLQASGGVSYQWSPVTGLNNANIANPTANPSSTTEYVVTVTNAAGCQDTDTVLVEVNPALFADAGIDQNMEFGDTITLGGSPSASGGSGSTYSYSWTPVSGISDPANSNPDAYPIVSTSYTLTVTDSAGCQVSDIVIIVVEGTIVADAGTDKTICPGENVTIGGNPSAFGSDPPFVYSWSPSVGLNDSTLANPVAGPLQTTVYVLTVTNDSLLIDSDTITVFVQAEVMADAGIDTEICIGGTVQLNADGGVDYVWSHATTLDNADIASPAASPLETTNYVVTVTDSNGCTGTDSVTIAVNSLPDFTISDNFEICIGTTTNLIVTPVSIIEPYTFSWSPLTGLSDETSLSPLASPDSDQMYTFSVSDDNGCTSADSVFVKVNPLPNVTTISDTTVCEGESITLFASGGLDYEWSPGDRLDNPNIANPTFESVDIGDFVYSVFVTDGKGCQGFAEVTVSVETCVGIEQVSFNDLIIHAYPNPANEILHLSFESDKLDQVTFSIYNLTGQLTDQLAVSNKSQSILQVSDYPAGIYMIEIRETKTGELAGRKKLVISR